MEKWAKYKPLLFVLLAILLMLLAIRLVMGGEGFSEYDYDYGP